MVAKVRFWLSESSRSIAKVSLSIMILESLFLYSLLDQPERGKGPPEGKFMRLGGKVNFGVLSQKIDVIRAKNGAITLVLTNKASFSC